MSTPGVPEQALGHLIPLSEGKLKWNWVPVAGPRFIIHISALRPSRLSSHSFPCSVFLPTPKLCAQGIRSFQVLSLLSYVLNYREKGNNLLQKAVSPAALQGTKGRTFLWNLHGLCVFCRRFQVPWPRPDGLRVQLSTCLVVSTQCRSFTSPGPLHELGRVLKDSGLMISYLLCYLSQGTKDVNLVAHDLIRTS